MQEELKALQKSIGITFVFVTHDQGEALSMADRIAVFNEGRIEQVGTPEEVYNRPAKPFVADFVGSSNVLPPEVTHAVAGLRSCTLGVLYDVGPRDEPSTLAGLAHFTEHLMFEGSQHVAPGRFDELVYVGTPDFAGRVHILGIHTAKMPLAGNVSLEDIAERTERFTGADLEDVVRRAGLIAIRKRGADVEAVDRADFDEALDDSRATVTEEMEAEYGRMKGELKKRAMEVTPIGFIAPGMLESRREKKHG